jgi:hypothetical protein
MAAYARQLQKDVELAHWGIKPTWSSAELPLDGDGRRWSGCCRSNTSPKAAVMFGALIGECRARHNGGPPGVQ